MTRHFWNSTLIRRKRRSWGCFHLAGRAAGLATEQPVASFSPLALFSPHSGMQQPCPRASPGAVAPSLILPNSPSPCCLEPGWAGFPSRFQNCHPAAGDGRKAWFRASCLPAGLQQYNLGSSLPDNLIYSSGAPAWAWQSHPWVLFCKGLAPSPAVNYRPASQIFLFCY